LNPRIKKGDKHYKAAQAKFIGWLDQLNNYRVLDSACGSGNFLFLGLKVLKDIEHQSHLDATAMGLDREADLVTGPHNMLGIELNEYAAELARVRCASGNLRCSKWPEILETSPLRGRRTSKILIRPLLRCSAQPGRGGERIPR